MKKVLSLAVCCSFLAACYPDIPEQEDAVDYRDLATHPGYTAEGLSYTNADIPGYEGSAKAYAFPSGVTEDTKKPIVLLFHGNSSTPADFERYPANDGMPQLSERLVAQGFRVYAIDYRIDKVDDPKTNYTTENAALNVDHGWTVPLAAHFIESVLNANEGRKISLVGFSLGTTVLRDALRKLYVQEKRPYERVQHVIGLAGANHGVSTYRALCGTNPTMRGRVACEMGDRTAYTPTEFMTVLNADETPCADGEKAYGTAGVCGGNEVKYVTLVMRDKQDGTYQDEFVSEASAHLEGADNQLLELTDNDTSGYFLNGLFKNHMGSARSAAAVDKVVGALSN